MSVILIATTLKPYFDHSVRTAPTQDIDLVPVPSPFAEQNQTAEIPKPVPASIAPAPKTKPKQKHPHTNLDGTHDFDRIVQARIRNGQQQYRVKWKGYRETSWEPESNFDKNFLHAYHKLYTKQGKKRKRTNTNKIKFFKN